MVGLVVGEEVRGGVFWARVSHAERVGICHQRNLLETRMESKLALQSNQVALVLVRSKCKVIHQIFVFRYIQK